jgi:hypothetical protein
MNTSMKKVTSALGVVLFLSSAALLPVVTSIEIGDVVCGVDGADFLDDTFAGLWRVSGSPGCAMGSETDCYCSPILGDADPLGPWIWQCNSASSEVLVPFGPATGKVCPSEIPVPLGFNEAKNPECDTTINPTGQLDDPPCEYSDCDSGGDFSAVCGCVDLTFGAGEANPGDLQWFCLHATCTCPTQSSASSLSFLGAATTLPFAFAVVSFFFMH